MNKGGSTVFLYRVMPIRTERSCPSYRSYDTTLVQCIPRGRDLHTDPAEEQILAVDSLPASINQRSNIVRAKEKKDNQERSYGVSIW